MYAKRAKIVLVRVTKLMMLLPAAMLSRQREWRNPVAGEGEAAGSSSAALSAIGSG